MKTVATLSTTLLLILGLAGAIWSEIVFTTEPETPLRPRPGLRISAFTKVPWGNKYEQVKKVGRWVRVQMTDTSDVFIYSEWLATYDVVEEKAAAEDARAVYFEVERYLGSPVLEAMCRHIAGEMQEQHPAVQKLTIEGYLVGTFPKGERLCSARWVAGSPIEIDVPEMPSVTPREEEIFEWLGELYRSEERKGVPIFACDSLWIEAGEELDMTPAEARFVYDRVRWSRTKTSAREKLKPLLEQ
jgi:hypothetical protein